jgi:hypothetical protein
MMLDRLVQFMVSVGDTALASLMRLGVRTGNEREEQQSRQDRDAERQPLRLSQLVVCSKAHANSPLMAAPDRHVRK